MNHCETCHKSTTLCLCDVVQPHKTHTHILILQHPQEPDHEIGSALLAHQALENSTLKIGLSWRNLSALLNKKTVDPTRWVVLYLGSGIKGDIKKLEQLQFVSKRGHPTEKPKKIEGIIILDGTWSQAKTLWWRNAWLLKLPRAILNPAHKSLYRELRKEPRKECLSTIESIADTLDVLGESPKVSQHLRDLFSQLLMRYRKNKK